eukprot:3625830-Amphidinium_carterae.1
MPVCSVWNGAYGDGQVPKCSSALSLRHFMRGCSELDASSCGDLPTCRALVGTGYNARYIEVQEGMDREHHEQNLMNYLLVLHSVHMVVHMLYNCLWHLLATYMNHDSKSKT